MLSFRTAPHIIFEQIVQEHSNCTAISFCGKHLTYQELNNKANQLAHWLILKGIKPEHRVGVCLKPSFEIVIALLAIQKVGAVYLPIDPSYPKARIKSIAEDAAINLTLTQQDVIENLGEFLPNIYSYCKDTSFLDYSSDNPGIEISEENTAYIIYTSGTTGLPKGIAISYENFAFYIRSLINQFNLNSADVTLTIARFSFSISLFDLMGSIVSGGRLIVLPREDIMDYGRLSAALEQATLVHIGPNLLKGLVDYIKKNYSTYDCFSQFRHISSGGDIVPVELLTELRTIFTSAEIYIIYGCTEISCMGCYYLAPQDTDIEKAFIGKPFFGAEVLVLSEDGKEAPDGAVGEICFRGSGIMKGYLNQPELTQKAFVQVGNADYFKTGDMGRRHPSGNLEYLGRRDFQIKLRGQRVELVEIESHLRKAPGVQDAIVTAINIGTYDKRLIAYITLENQHHFALDVIRASLSKHLPDYMQPSGWIVLDQMPLNENFKISRRSLPMPTLGNLIVTQTYVAPNSEIERTLSTIFQQILDIPRVGINDNFFDIGGDSLMAMNVCMLAAEKGIRVSASQLALTPTVVSLIEAGIRQDTELDEFVGNFTSSGLLQALPPFIYRFLYERGAQTPHRWNISRQLVLKQYLPFTLLKAAMRHLCARHDALRLKFDCQDNQWQASILETSEETLSCRLVDLSNLSRAEQTAAILETAKHAQSAVNLTTGPIVCMILFELGQVQPQELFFVVHHFAMDVISWKAFWLEFELVCQRLKAGSNPMLSAPPVSFKAWTQTLRQYANSSGVEADVQRWIQQTWSEVLPLPKDFRNHPALNTNASARVVKFILPEAETQAILRSGAHGLSVESILMSGLAVALCRWQNSNVAYFDRLVHGRNAVVPELDLSRTLACIVSYAPMLLKIDPHTDVSAIVLAVAKQVEQVGDSGTSIDLYRYLGANLESVQKLKALPRAEVLFNYRGKFDDVIEKSRLFGKSVEIAGLDHSPEGLRQYPLAISIDVIHKTLDIRFVYSTNIHQQESITAVSELFLNFLRLVVSRSLVAA